jgi:hypothetical protein
MDRRRWVLLAVCALLVAAAIACGSQTGAPNDAGTFDAGGPADASSAADGHEDAVSVADVGPDALDASDGGADSSQGGDAVGHTDAGAEVGGEGSADASAEASADADSSASFDVAVVDTSAGDAPGSDGASDAPASDGPGGILTGGPCVSGATGATAYRVRWIDAGGTAQVQYEVDGLPDTSRDQTGAYGYQIGFTPSYVDPFLGAGGLQLDDTDFVDIEISTVGISSITSVTLSLFGRSYSVDTNGSFSWQTFDGTGQTATDFVSNVAPYQWYSADVTGDILPGENNVLLRIKAGPSSDALVVNRIELCMVAQ